VHFLILIKNVNVRIIKKMTSKPGLYYYMNKRKKAGTSRSKENSTVSPEAYAQAAKGFINNKKKRKKNDEPNSVKGVSLTGLSSSNKNKMIAHSNHHTKKHLKVMASELRKDKSFKQSHDIAMKKVGA
jgi:hypothetical protein